MARNHACRPSTFPFDRASFILMEMSRARFSIRPIPQADTLWHDKYTCFAKGVISGTVSGTNGRCDMLWTIAVVLLILWLLGLSMHVGGGLVHLLLVIAAVVVLIRIIQGRRVV